MPKQIDLTAKPRPRLGRSAAKQARRNGTVPAVLYGKHIKPQHLSVSALDVKKLLSHGRSSHAMVNLTIEDNGSKQTHLALVQELQIDPLQDTVIHVDFHQLSASEKFRVRVPVRAVGEPVGVKEGGIMEYLIREVEIECLPKDLPDVIEVDVTNLKLGASIFLGDLKVADGITLRGDKSRPVITIAMPTTEEQLAAEAEAATGEVEVITAKKEEGESAAEATAKPESKDAKAAPAAGAKASAPAAGAKSADTKPAAGAAPAKSAAPAADKGKK
jgi:large subunit ribosomal protein L25